MTRHTIDKGPTKAPLNRQDQVNEILKCGTDPLYFINRYVKISHPDRGIVPFKTYPFQEDCVRAYLEHRFVIVNKSRQLGLSTVSAAYSLWLALFQKEKNILVIATKAKTAMLFIRKIKGMLKLLPQWLLITTIKGESMQHLEFKNGSRIEATPTSESAGRGDAVSLLVTDECILPSTYVHVRNKKTGEVRVTTIQSLFTSPEYQ